MASDSAFPDDAAPSHEQLRRRTIGLFKWWGVPQAGDLADRTLDRVARKLEEGAVIPEGAIGAYVRGIARMVYYEWSREPRPPQKATVEVAATDSTGAGASRKRRVGSFEGEEWLTGQTFRTYLLGGASDADAARLEERLLQDEQVFAEVEGVEDELFEAFVRKQLTERDMELFRAKYGHQVDSIAFARALAPRSEGVAAPRAARWNWLPVAIAATIVLAAGGYVLVRDTGRTAPAAADAAARETAAPAAPPTIALLRLGGTREAAAGGQRITLADDTPSIRLRVQLGPADRFDLYSLQLRSAAKAIVWEVRERAVMEGGELVVEGAVAANLVPDGPYELAVRGANANAAFAPLGLVPLRIARTR